MNFTPVGKYLLIEPITSPPEKKKTKVLLPEDYKPKGAVRYKMCRVVTVGPECAKNIEANTLAVIENSMVEKIEVLENIFYVILENYVVGVIDRK